MPGDAHPRVARFDEFELGGGVADRLCRRPAGREGAVDRAWAATRTNLYGRPARRRSPPSSLLQESGCGWPASASAIAWWKPRQRGADTGARSTCPCSTPMPSRDERGEQPARARVVGELAEEGLRVDRALEQRARAASGRGTADPSLRRKGDASGRRTVRKWAWSAGQRLGQRGGGGVCLFRLPGVDDQRPAGRWNCGKSLVQQLSARCRQGRLAGEHLVRIGRDAEMAGRVPAGEAARSKAAKTTRRAWRRQKSTKPDEQALECHRTYLSHGREEHRTGEWSRQPYSGYACWT